MRARRSSRRFHWRNAMRCNPTCVIPIVMLAWPMSNPARADVITDWNEKAVAYVTPKMPPPAAQRAMAIVHVAMFDAVNSIERRYRPYLLQRPAAATTSKEAAAAAAAVTILSGIHPQGAAELTAAMNAYLAAIPDGESKAQGIELGTAIAAGILEVRRKDGADAPDIYRPHTRAGAYIPTAPMVGSTWPDIKPFAMSAGSQFRPQAPVSLQSGEWSADYNEIKDLGGKVSAKRSPKQTEDAGFWLITGPQSADPIVRQLVTARQMSVIDSARTMALTSVAAADAYIAVLDAKYHYNFWRPVTAIRNGDMDDNPSTERDAAWQPIDNTPMHPEYPCAHCIHSAAIATTLETLLGGADVPEFTMTSSMAPGITHRWSNLWAYANEVYEARIWAGFHYRFSGKVGQDMGRQIGHHAVQSVMQPATVANAR